MKRQRSNWDGPSANSQLCSKHFTEDCFITERIWFHKEMGIPTLKCLKPDTVPMIFARSVDYLQASCSRSTTPMSGRPLSKEDSKEWREHKLYMVTCIYTATLYETESMILQHSYYNKNDRLWLNYYLQTVKHLWIRVMIWMTQLLHLQPSIHLIHCHRLQ